MDGFLGESIVCKNIHQRNKICIPKNIVKPTKLINFIFYLKNVKGKNDSLFENVIFVSVFFIGLILRYEYEKNLNI